MNGAPLNLREIVVRYPKSERNAVDRVTLDVAAGELIVFLGPSGCGKSTLMRTINRLVVPDSGTIEIDGIDAKGMSPELLRRGIGYAIQAVGLFPHMTVGQNIAIVPGLVGWDKARVAKRVDDLLALVSLEPARYRDRLPRELSGGEQQRVGVARAIAAEPRVLLMDEPFGAVDAIVRASLQDEISRIHAKLGTTILFVTHDVDEALRLADRIVVMRDGHIEQADAPLALLAAPATPYVANLLDTRDAVRRLGLMRIGDLPAAPKPPSDAAAGAAAAISPDATLREALAQLLAGPGRLAIGGDAGRTIGFDDIRRAIAPPRPRTTPSTIRPRSSS